MTPGSKKAVTNGRSRFSLFFSFNLFWHASWKFSLTIRFRLLDLHYHSETEGMFGDLIGSSYSDLSLLDILAPAAQRSVDNHYDEILTYTTLIPDEQVVGSFLDIGPTKTPRVSAKGTSQQHPRGTSPYSRSSTYLAVRD